MVGLFSLAIVVVVVELCDTVSTLSGLSLSACGRNSLAVEKTIYSTTTNCKKIWLAKSDVLCVCMRCDDHWNAT